MVAKSAPTPTSPLDTARAGYEKSCIAMLDAVVTRLLKATRIDVPDFEALARSAADTGGPADVPGGAPDTAPASPFTTDPITLKGIAGLNPYASEDPVAQARVAFVRAVHEAKKPPHTWSEICRKLDKTEPQARRFALKALKTKYLLPRSYAATVKAGTGYDRLDYAAGRAFDIHPDMWDFLDRCLATVEEHAGMQSFKATVDTAIALLRTPSHNGERAHEERCVRSYNLDDGRSVVEMTGPTLEIEAFMKRLEAFARAIRTNLAGLLTDAQTADGESLADAGIDPATVQLADTRAMRQLMFDMVTGYAPTLGITVTHTSKNSEGAGSAADAGSDDRIRAAGPSPDIAETLVLHMPTRESWLASQARVSVLVPVSTALGIGKAPASLAGVSAIPDDVARQLVGTQHALYRLLCDPATGRILPEQATSYQISPAMRRTLEGQWTWCAMPGCTQPAARCETEHIRPFNHEDPRAGGPSDFSNLEVLCRRHHQLKTAGLIDVSVNPDGSLTFAWTSPTAPTGHTDRVAAHRHLAGAIAARELADHLDRLLAEARAARLPHESPPAPTDAADNETGSHSETDSDAALFPLARNWKSLNRDEKTLPAIRGLRDMLAASGLLPPLPPLRLTRSQEIEVLYRIAQAQHACHTGPGGTCIPDACPKHAHSTGPADRADCLGVGSDAPTPCNAREQGPQAQNAQEQRPRCPYSTAYAPYGWKPAGWADWLHHRTLAQVLADPWRHNDPVDTHTDPANFTDAQDRIQAELDADEPPF